MHSLLARVPRRDDKAHLVKPGARDHDKEFFDGRIADGETSNGLGASMDHDVAAKDRKVAPVRTGPLDISCIRIVNAQRQMIPAVRIQKLDAIEAFGNLLVALTELWTGSSTRGQDRIREKRN